MAEGVYNLTDVWFCFGSDHDWNYPHFKCGYLKNEELYEYLNQIENFVPPLNRCMQYYCHFVLRLNPRKIHETMKPQRSLYIVNKNPLYMKCPCGTACVKQYTKYREKHLESCAKQCFHNIECGNCKDPFIVENIGKVFFANKYKNNNQR